MNEKEWMSYCVKLKDKHPILERRYQQKAKQGKVGVISHGGKGNIPILFANGKSLAEAWENSLIALWTQGGFVRTQYDGTDSSGSYIVAPSKDCTMTMVVEDPLSEPMIHKDFPGGPNDLEEYRQEVVLGIKDHWIRDPENPDDKRWEYTYHGRVVGYDVPGLERTIDQLEAMAKGLAKSPITRRCQVVTWKPWEDIGIADPACFQSMWGRILRQHPNPAQFKFYSDEETGKPKLNLNIRFRSRDAYGAAFMNTFAFIDWARYLARRISDIRDEEVTLGRVMDLSDSYHIYGKDFGDFLGRFVKGLQTRHFLPREDNDIKARTMNSDSELAQIMFDEARRVIPIKVAEQDEKYAQGEELTKDSAKIFKDP